MHEVISGRNEDRQVVVQPVLIPGALRFAEAFRKETWRGERWCRDADPALRFREAAQAWVNEMGADKG